jgi:hypothetical protein
MCRLGKAKGVARTLPRNCHRIPDVPLHQTLRHICFCVPVRGKQPDYGARPAEHRHCSLSTLTVLALSGNKIADPGMISLALAIPPCLATLNLNFNAVGGEGARALAAALPQSGLSVVYLDGNRCPASPPIPSRQRHPLPKRSPPYIP